MRTLALNGESKLLPQSIFAQEIFTTATILVVVLSFLEIPATAQTVFTDPSWDSSAYGSFTLPIPDVVAVGGGYDASNVYLSAAFRTGSLNYANLGFVFYLDVDQNAATGAQGTGAPRGFDYWLFFSTELNQSVATVSLMSPYQQMGTVPITFGIDSLNASVPLSLLNNDNGIVNFGFAVGQPIPGTGGVSIFDFAPNYTAGMILTASTTPIPEPTTWSLLALGIGALLGGCRMRRRS